MTEAYLAHDLQMALEETLRDYLELAAEPHVRLVNQRNWAGAASELRR